MNQGVSVMDPMIPNCPVCGQTMDIRRLECSHCGVTVEGHFRSAFGGLAPDLADFAERFIKARGNLKELERATGLSYPTLRTRLDDLVQAMGGDVSERQAPSLAENVLERLRAGEISAQEAVGLLRGEEHGEAETKDGEEDEP